jgi:hypothetical protein
MDPIGSTAEDIALVLGGMEAVVVAVDVDVAAV